MRRIAILAAATLLAACQHDGPQPLLGTTEWDRVELVAEASEPVLEVATREGTDVKAGDVLVRLDPRRADAELASANAEVARLDALLLEQRNGFRSEQIDEARARVAAAFRHFLLLIDMATTLQERIGIALSAIRHPRTGEDIVASQMVRDGARETTDGIRARLAGTSPDALERLAHLVARAPRSAHADRRAFPRARADRKSVV